MKTLDEVIKGFECCENIDCGNCPYKILFNDDSHVPCDQFSKDEDALHYLKELKDILDPLKVKKISHEITCPKCNSVIAILSPESNEPLTWDELKTMEGKPVWMEWTVRGEWRNGEWDLIHALIDDRIWFTDENGEITDVPKEWQGKTWQAYRKERSS